jgi:peroxiredoxin
MLRVSLLLAFSALFARADVLDEFRLADTTGTIHTPAEWKGTRGVVLVFLAIDCPISNGYVPELKRIYEKYAAQGVKFYGVQSDPRQNAKASAKFVADFGLPFPLLLDPQQVLANGTGASTTPEVALLSMTGRTRYMGRIDNLYVQIGQKRHAATEFDLRDSLDIVLSGKSIEKDRAKAVGCSIPKV